jgi:preprotein translocase subunit SecD
MKRQAMSDVADKPAQKYGAGTFDPDKEYDVILSEPVPFAGDVLPRSRTIRMLGSFASEIADKIAESVEAGALPVAVTPNGEYTSHGEPSHTAPPRDATGTLDDSRRGNM